MSKTCRTCKHPEKQAIDKALLADVSLRDVAKQYSLPTMSVQRHKEKHLPATLVKAQESKEIAHSIDLMEELKRLFERCNLLFDACDRWLRDPDDFTRYDIGPRAEGIKVIYEEMGTNGKPVRRKAPLDRLMARLNESGIAVQGWESKHADPRELILKTAAQLQGQTELLAKLIGDLDESPKVEVNVGDSLSADQKQQFRDYLLHRNGR